MKTDVKAMRCRRLQGAVLLVLAWLLGGAGPQGNPGATPGGYPGVEPYELSELARPRTNLVDRTAFDYWHKHKRRPALPCSDAVFLRRVYLDVIGTLPTLDEAKQFLDDQRVNKRALLIEALLNRPEFADYWAMKWGDLLRIKAEFPINLWPNAVQAYHQWLRDSLRENRPYDQMARQLLTASGSNFRTPPVNFYRAVQSRQPPALAQAVALTFLGQRLDRWQPQDQAALAVFFSQLEYKPTGEWKEEIVQCTPPAADAKPRRVKLPDGKRVTLQPDDDPRQVFADWLITADNPWFAPVVVNRIWFWLLGQGLVDEPDDFRADNPPAIPKLLDVLARDLVQQDYDLRSVYRTILHSQLYQLSFLPPAEDPAAGDVFACYRPRRLDAEVLIDAINQITGTHEEYYSPIPEPFTIIPEGQRSIALGDGSITSSFLEQFGRPARDTGLLVERNDALTPAQSLHLLNSTHIRRKLQQSPTLRQLFGRYRNDPRALAEAIYLTVLSRYPTADEWLAVQQYAQQVKNAKPGEVALDLVWALINSPEFLYRH